MNATSGGTTTLSAPLGHIPVHIRSGAAILLHSKPGYTTTETLKSPYSLLVSISFDGSAFGTAYVDDGITLPTEDNIVSNRTLMFSVAGASLSISSQGNWKVEQKLEILTVLGVESQPDGVSVDGIKGTSGFTYESGLQRLNVTGLGLDLNAEGPTVVSW